VIPVATALKERLILLPFAAFRITCSIHPCYGDEAGNPVEMSLRSHKGPASPAPVFGSALWALGFRPFYLLASLFAAASMLLWVAQYTGILPFAYSAGPVWHGHEMLFGFATAVIAGFLLTAVATWTGQPPLRGIALMALALLWVVARVLMLTPFGLAATLFNAFFPLAVAVAVAIPVLRTGNRRNLVFVGLLGLLAMLALLVHLASQGLVDVPQGLGLQAGLDVVLLVMVIVTGRVVPMFTNNGVPGAGAVRHFLLEATALGTIVLLLIADLLQWEGVSVALLAGFAAAVQAARLCLWRPWRTLRTPLVWILHASCAWIVLHLALRGLSPAGWFAPVLATHALTVGAIGGLTIGMMTRTARGHTGLPLRAGRTETAMFVLIQAAALVRVGGGLIAPAHHLLNIRLSGALWSLAFALYAAAYWQVLTRPRLDGRPG
jgi:uncharacterized protein involved in response to NO